MEQPIPKPVDSTWGRLGLAAGAVVCVPPLPLFGIKLPTLPALEQGLLTAVFVASAAACSLAAARWSASSPSRHSSSG